MRRFVVLLAVMVMAMSTLALSATARPAAKRGGLKLHSTSMTPVRNDALTAALRSGRLSKAQYALHRARSLFDPASVESEFGSVAKQDPHAATLILQDLALRLDSLSADERAAAIDILERPSQGGANDGTLEYNTAEAPPVDSPNFRIHYVASTAHASTLADATATSVVMEQVWTQEVNVMGWRAPKSDQNAQQNGGDAKFDVYLGDVGNMGLYGYCTTDPGQQTYDQYSYCVLDNDFAEFFLSPDESRKATAAHEFAHAIQFSYDVTDDLWFMESTATWMEDEVYDPINDNYQYLRSSPLGRPMTPADTWTDFSNPGDPDTGFQYGTFIWMRYISEKFSDPTIIRQMWERADAKTTGPNSLYSLEAIEQTLNARGTNFATSFADFAARNAKASLFYEEGAAYEARVAPVRTGSHSVVPGTPVMGAVNDVDHLSSRVIRLTAGAGVTSTDQVTVAVDMGNSPMQKAMLVNLAGGGMTVTEIPLTSGEGNATVPLGGQTEVVLVLVNASNRMNNCAGWRPGDFSCGGTPAHENQAFTYSANVGTTAVDPGEPTGGGGGDTVAPNLTNVTVKPSPIPRGKLAKIFFTIDEAAKVNIKILHGGRKVAANSFNLPDPARYYVEWQTGRKQDTGKYTIKLTATDAAGNKDTATKDVKVVK